MSTSTMYHVYGARTYRYLKTEYKGGAVYYHVEKKERHRRCVECKSRDITFDSLEEVTLKTVPCGSKAVFLVLHLRVLKCRDCGAKRQESRDVAEPRKSYTRQFANYVLDLVKQMTIQAVARHLRVSWDLVKDIHKRSLKKKYRHVRLKGVEYIAIDEFSVRKGWVYMTIAIDLRDGRILHAAPGKGAASIKPFLKTLARRAPNLKAVAVDMNEGYISALRRFLPKVDIVLDRYHISALVNRGIDELRRAHQAELGRLGNKTIKGSRFLLLANYDDLRGKRKRRLDRLLEVNGPLYVMHAMKEQLRLFWDLGRTDAERFLEAWCRDAMDSAIVPLIKVGKTLALYRSLILNYFKHRISCGKIEGINNKIKTLKRQHYGFRDEEYFKLRLFNLHEQRYQLTG